MCGLVNILSPYNKMLSGIKNIYQPLDTGLVTEACQSDSELNTRKCSHLWPKYPCYNKKLRQCESTSGEANLDPIDDILYSVGESYVALNKLVGKIFNALPEERRLEKEEKLIRFFREYGTTLTPISNPDLARLDTIRFHDVDGYLDQAGNKLTRRAVADDAPPARRAHRGGTLFQTIVHPKTGKKVSITSRQGKAIIKKYLKLLME